MEQETEQQPTHTEPAPEPPANTPPPPPPTPEPAQHGDNDAGRLSALEDTVRSLVNGVTALTNEKSALKEPDSKPIKLPWTHRKWF